MGHARKTSPVVGENTKKEQCMADMKYSEDSIWAKRNFLDFFQDIMDTTAETSSASDHRNTVNDRDNKKAWYVDLPRSPARECFRRSSLRGHLFESSSLWPSPR